MRNYLFLLFISYMICISCISSKDYFNYSNNFNTNHSHVSPLPSQTPYQLKPDIVAKIDMSVFTIAYLNGILDKIQWR